RGDYGHRQGGSAVQTASRAAEPREAPRQSRKRGDGADPSQERPVNCHDISQILDDRDIRALTSAEREQVDSHLGTCCDCADEWAAHERMLLAPMSPMPEPLM